MSRRTNTAPAAATVTTYDAPKASGASGVSVAIVLPVPSTTLAGSSSPPTWARVMVVVSIVAGDIASEKVTGKVLDADDQRRLIDEAVGEIDFDRLASRN